jgi:hypothetical protein
VSTGTASWSLAGGYADKKQLHQQKRLPPPDEEAVVESGAAIVDRR